MDKKKKKANCELAILILSISYLSIVMLLFLNDFFGALLMASDQAAFYAIGAFLIKMLLGSLLVSMAVRKKAHEMVSVAVFAIIFSWNMPILIVIAAVILAIVVYMKRNLLKETDSETEIEFTGKTEVTEISKADRCPIGITANIVLGALALKAVSESSLITLILKIFSGIQSEQAAGNGTSLGGDTIVYVLLEMIVVCAILVGIVLAILKKHFVLAIILILVQIVCAFIRESPLELTVYFIMLLLLTVSRKSRQYFIKSEV